MAVITVNVHMIVETWRTPKATATTKAPSTAPAAAPAAATAAVCATINADWSSTMNAALVHGHAWTSAHSMQILSLHARAADYEASIKLMNRFKKLGYTPHQLSRCRQYIQYQARMLIHFNVIKSFPSMAIDSTYRTRHEYMRITGEADTDKSLHRRTERERDLFHYPLSTPVSERPRYASCDWIGHSVGDVYYRQAFGSSYMTLRRSRVAPFVTMSPQNSARHAKAYPLRRPLDHYVDTLSCHCRFLNSFDNHELSALVRTATGDESVKLVRHPACFDSKRPESIWLTQREAQVHSIIDIRTDVESIHLDDKWKRHPAVMAAVDLLIKNGVAVLHDDNQPLHAHAAAAPSASTSSASRPSPSRSPSTSTLTHKSDTNGDHEKHQQQQQPQPQPQTIDASTSSTSSAAPADEDANLSISHASSTSTSSASASDGAQFSSVTSKSTDAVTDAVTDTASTAHLTPAITAVRVAAAAVATANVDANDKQTLAKADAGKDAAATPTTDAKTKLTATSTPTASADERIKIIWFKPYCL